MQEFEFWSKLKIRERIFFFLIGAVLSGFFLVTTSYFVWEKNYEGRVYPGVKIEDENFGGKKPEEIEKYFQEKNNKIALKFSFRYQSEVATVSARDINWGWDGKLMAAQAFSFGRSGNLASDLYQKIIALKNNYNLPPSYYYNEQLLLNSLEKMAKKIDRPPQEALFRFAGGRVAAFRPSESGQTLNTEVLKKTIGEDRSFLQSKNLPDLITIEAPIKNLEPKVTTAQANNLGVRELVGEGSSRFLGSIPNRIYNIQLAASRLNGILVAPGEVFSFNKALGDVSKFTGYKEAYIIQEGRTILGDGGGVCQVSTTLFRALLNTGLPVIERHAHSYRVGYYEQGSPPGIDASVYDPRWDLKFKNDTADYLLIQAEINYKTASLTFYLYGTKDNRVVTLSKPNIKNRVPPPEDLYQDDPGLPKGEVKQVDWKAEGADISFTRKVEKDGETLIQETFSSHYQPWQAIFLRGTKE